MNNILDDLKRDLEKGADEKTKLSFQRFFKEKVRFYGVSTGTVGKISKFHWKEVTHLPKERIFELCEALYKSDITEEAFVVSFWLPNLVPKMAKEDIFVLKRFIDSYVNNWAKCDGLCNHTVGDLIEKYPELVSELKTWAKSENLWLRRAAAVSLIVPAKRGRFLKDAFEIADMLLTDKEDMVQKGYGWLLKEESRKHQTDVLDYVMKNKAVMPRTALRYAIELMPNELRIKAMEKAKK